MARLVTTLPWTAEIDGDDLVVLNIKATCFGGGFDKDDPGDTASGVKNNGSDPTLLGVALPIENMASTNNSPLCFGAARVLWKSTVIVWLAAKPDFKVSAILIDNGPSTVTYPDRALDMNPALASKFAPGKTPFQLANGWTGTGFCYRLVGGAKVVPKDRIAPDPVAGVPAAKSVGP